MRGCSVYFSHKKTGLIHDVISITGLLLLTYALLIFYYNYLWHRIPPVNNPVIPAPSTCVSIIIPARNEADSVQKCLDALVKQTYPAVLTEIIVVNDFSTDSTADLVMNHPIHCTLLNLADVVSENLNSYKKKAIERGIAHSKGELIICTDADCIMAPEWIGLLVDAYQHQHLTFIAGPVKINTDGSWLSVFQALDFIALQGITAVSVFRNLYPMCNGANLAYTRKAFDEVCGFEGIDRIASGDDMLLMKKIQHRFPGTTGYLKDNRAIVSTTAAKTLRAFFNQRIRWASKTAHYDHNATFLTLVLVYLVNLSLLFLFFCCLFCGHWRWLILLVVFKTISEFFFVYKVAAFFDQQKWMKYFLFFQPFHILYTVIAGSFGRFGKYEWKNRKVN